VSKLYPERFARKRTYALGKMSGKASLLKNLEELGIALSVEDQKKVLDRVVQLGDSKQRITPDDLPFIIADVLERDLFQHIVLVRCDLQSQMDKQAVASVAVEIDGVAYAAEGQGNGGFDAFTAAIGEILAQLDLVLPELLDYQVHIPRGGHTNALTEASVTWKLPNNAKITTRGMHANQVFAAVEATLRVLNRLLHERMQ